MKYAEKVVLVTGGASGIGKATVKKFAEEGAKVVFTDMNDNLGPDFERELKEAGHEALFLISDATKEDQVEQLIAKIVETYGKLDVAINNVGNMAGGDRPGLKLHETSDEAFEGTLSVSLRDNFYSMKHEIIQMLKQGGGVIANTVSAAGLIVTESASPSYSAAKAGTIHLTRFAAVTYAKNNIRVNAVAPGVVNTPGLAEILNEEQRAAIASMHPMNRIMEPEEIADAFIWVCSDAASAVTGVVIPVDGGVVAK